MKKPTYIIFAGVNGAGKSTFYHTGYWRECDFPSSILRVNSDEILLEQNGDYTSATDQLAAGKEALKLIEKALERRLDFCQETTLTGKLSLRTIKRAKNAGYYVALYYIGVASPRISLERIAHRVDIGGHPISEQDVFRRFTSSLSNLAKALDWCDEVTAIDNTIEFVTVAKWTKGVLSWVGNLKKHAPWLLRAASDDDIWKR